MFTPSTVIRLLQNVDLTNEYNNTFSFSTETAQSSFFIGKTKNVFTDFVYQRKEKTVKVGVNIETLWNVSYMMFQNSNFGSKWFYAFITDMRYLNDSTTEIFFEIDVMQTWYFDVDIKDCYIEREHVESDEIGKHLLDENLATGEYINRALVGVQPLATQAIVISTSAIVENFSTGGTTVVDVIGGNYTGVYSGLVYVPFLASSWSDVNDYIKLIDDAGKGDAINNIFMMPNILLGSYTEGEVLFALNANDFDYSYPKNTSDIDGYIPRNNKMFVYPYNFLYVSNHGGGFATYKYEFSTDTQMEFNIVSNIAPAPTVYLRPKNYKGQVLNFDESLTLQDYPLCNWVKDVYSNWLAQNIVSAPLGVVSSGLALGVGIATANPIAIAGGAIGVANSIGGFVEQAIQPNQARGSSRGGANTAIGIQTYGIYPKTITAEYAQIIDNYFHRFGYKVNVLKTPNLTSRQNWNYIRMIEVNVFGNIPNKDLQQIHKVFKDGITYWHNDNIGNYNRSNPII